MNVVTTVCPSCGAEILIEYHLLGAATTCVGCARDIVPQVPVGGTIPATNWDLTFHDFKRLIETPSYRSHIAPLISEWFGYHLEGEESDTQILNSHGEALSALWLHLKIQSTQVKQFALYQKAMSLWR